MKLIFLSLALVISATGCEQKTNLTTPSTVTGTTSSQKIQEVTEQKNEMPQESSKMLPKTTKNSESKSVTAVSVIAVKETAEQSLAEISTRSREVTKTQESKARNHAQNAEEEMLKDLGK
jgi:hypothetical protein